MKSVSKKIILGSGSPRRRELLAGLDIPFTVDTGNTFEESFPEGTPARIIPVLMAEGKSAGFHRPLRPDEILITADTVVILDYPDREPEVIGKPHSRQDAVAMLHKLSGRTHEVVTAVVIRDCERRKEFSVSSHVTFAPLSDDEIQYYIDKYKPFDKAGSYGIQEWIGYVGISGIEGSFYNVMGFPVHRVYRELQCFL
ncbi:MAG: septum formation protein Maf [Bacteroidales bacterium]|nr:septum formation protein Maf [Bacteroidales bacterium]MBR3501078.1 septum formation protein Maf [Bacteroidales bacterium]